MSLAATSSGGASRGPSGAPRPRRWARGALGLALLGGTFGTLLDAIHTQSGVTAYATPIVLDTAWWVPVLFGWAFVNGLARPLLDRGPAPTARTVVTAMGFFALAYVCSILPWPWPATSALLPAVFALVWSRCDRSVLGLAVAFASALLGPAFEVVLVRAGVFRHTRPAFLGVSGWLPFLYLTAAIAIQATAKWLVDGGERELDPNESAR